VGLLRRIDMVAVQALDMPIKEAARNGGRDGGIPSR
jgi:hypothetical protein